jgi:uncharacterized glyoxalase superfamily protein PhnB
VTFDRATPEGYHTVTPRIVVDDVAGFVAFLRVVFGATGDRELFPAFLYVYVADADESYRRAVNAGAETLEAPTTTPYGDRRAMVKDPFGNVFQIAHRLKA